MSAAPLLEAIRALLERTYGMSSGLAELSPFLIGDRGLRSLYLGPTSVGSAGSAGARTLVRETDGGIRACIYFPDELIRCLERFPPQRGIGIENAEAFATFVEEIDHLLVIAERARQERAVSLFELELHANVSKYFVLARFLAGRRGGLGPRERAWLRHQLFERGRYCDDDPDVRRRYEDAARWAVRLLEAMSRLDAARRLARLREFHRAGGAGKLELICRLA